MDCPICGLPIPQCSCICEECSKPLFGKAKKRCQCRNWYADCHNRIRDWSEARHRLDDYIENQVLSYTYKGKKYRMTGFHCKTVGIQKAFIAEFSSKADAVTPESVSHTLRRHMVLNCMFGDFNTTSDGKIHGYGNSVVVCKHLDLPFWSKVMVKLHEMAGSTPPSFLMDSIATEDGKGADVAPYVDSDNKCELPYGWRKRTGLQALPGVGPKLAQVISAELGANAFDAVMENPDILSNIKGIGETKLSEIKEFVNAIRKDEEDQSQKSEGKAYPMKPDDGSRLTAKGLYPTFSR